MGEPKRYRPINATIEAIEFNGDFPLSFLRTGETVCRAAATGHSIVVTQNGHDIQVNKGEYLLRHLASGELRKESAHHWFHRWEATDG